MWKKILVWAAAAVFLAGIVLSAFQLYRIQREYKTTEESYSTLMEHVSLPSEEETAPTETEAVPTENESVQPEEDIAWPQVDFAALAEVNEDIVAWLLIEGTEINYPVVQGSDNSYYLDHLFDGERNKAGCLFLDAANDAAFTERNSIIYGHHMKNGSMFAGLVGYKEQAFYEEHKRALLLTPDGNYEVLLFSGYVADVASSAWDSGFSEEGYAQWLREITEKSCFAAEVTASADDRVLTLSTCTYEFDDARFVVHGIIRK